MPAWKFLGKEGIENLKEWFRVRGRKILVYHRDVDGVCSAALFMKFFPDFRSIPREGPVIDDKFFREIAAEEPEILVFLDMPVDQEWKKVLRFAKDILGIRILIVDHHIPEKDMNSENIMHVNPRLRKRSTYMPASCVLYEMLREMGYAVRPWLWISLIGIIGDYGTKDCEWMFREYAETGEIPHCELVKAAETIASAITLKGLKGCEKVLKILLKSKRYEDFSKSSELRRWNTVVQKEVRNITDDFEKRKHVFEKEKVILYEIKSRMNITSIIATITAERYPDYIVMIRKRSGNMWKVSLRYQRGNISVGELAKFASKGIGSGGGHVKSAGALVNDWEKFRKRAFGFLQSS